MSIDLHGELRDLGTALNGMSVECPTVPPGLEAVGERLDREASSLNGTVVKFYEPVVDRVRELRQLCDGMHRALSSLVGLLVSVHRFAQEVQERRPQLTRPDPDAANPTETGKDSREEQTLLIQQVSSHIIITMIIINVIIMIVILDGTGAHGATEPGGRVQATLPGGHPPDAVGFGR
jgi:hypothetical protein